MNTDLINVQPLESAKTIGLNLAATYWTPENVGDTKRLYFVEIKSINQVIEETGELKSLNTAVFVDPVTKEVIHQASSRLVGIFEREMPQPLTPFQITYKGKKKNSTNAFSSDYWEVYYLTDGQKA